MQLQFELQSCDMKESFNNRLTPHYGWLVSKLGINPKTIKKNKNDEKLQSLVNHYVMH